MRKMAMDEFHEVLATYISEVAKRTDLSDPDTIVYSEEFDDLIRHIQSKPSSKLRMVYMRESADIKLLYRQLIVKLENKDEIKIL
jgi:hypothetical protein